MSRITRRATLVLALLSAACISRPPFLQPAPRREFADVLVAARQAASSGRYADADRLLAQFSIRYPQSEQSAEAAYWRAVFHLDPANRNGSLTTGLAELDQYVAGGGAQPHYVEATTLRRVAAQLAATTRLAATAVTTQTTQTAQTAQTAQAIQGRAAGADDKSRDEEIQRLKDALAKANDELERIKKRLTTPIRP